MTAHSLLGASSSHRWLACPGSFRLSQQLPHRPSSVYAATGSVAHALIEKCWDDHKYLDVTDIGTTWAFEGHTGTIDEGFVDGVNKMLDYLRSAAMTADWIEVEHQVQLHYPSPVAMFGTTDAIFKVGRVLEIGDYKNGAGVSVNPVENPQLLYYAVGALHTFQLWDEIDTLRLTVIQPHAGGEPIRCWTIDRVDLDMWVDDVLLPGVEAVTKDDAPLVTGPQCRFCPVAHGCPKLHEAAVEAAKHEFEEMPLSLNHLGPELELAEKAELWIARIREIALDHLKRQQPIDGWTLVPTRPTRQWRDDSTIELDLQKRGLSRGQVYETRPRSPAQLEKLLTRTKIGRQQWGEIVQLGLVEAKSSSVKLGRVHTTAAEEFANDE